MADCSPEGKAGPHDVLASIIHAMAPEILEKASGELMKSLQERGLNAKGELFSYDPRTTKH
ncbi:hypothetical protein [Escherichia coli]|uniref:Uncharacterized protein n=1 Tax=Escherichia coli TA447 TaxID=656447 RepID=A0A1X3J203_ECOLX|nr:hypothetical protein [Escherichia coli]OSK94389.1 hypothetical protein ECXG_03254 [Escherichia coli TA447]